MSSGDRWQKLYQKVDRDMHARDEADGRDREEDANKTAQEAWCARVTGEVLSAVHAQICERAEQFQAETGNTVYVTFPAEAPSASVAFAAHEMRFIRLALEDARIYVYSARAPLKLPALHLLSSAEQLRPSTAKRTRPSTRPGRPSTYPGRSSIAPPAKKAPAHGLGGDRVVSRSVGKVVKIDGDAWELRDRTSNAKLDPDSVVFKAFDMLVGTWRRMQQS